MTLPRLLFLISIFPILSQADDTPSRTTDFVEKCLTKIETDSRTIPGDEPNWFFPKSEIKQLSLGNFRSKPWETVSANGSNPVPSMVEFHGLLAEKGIPLLVVPIPAKASIYPEKLLSGFAPGEAPSLVPFIEELRTEGLNVLDLETHFLAKRKAGDETKYWSAQDAHYSPIACVEIANLIAKTLNESFEFPTSQNPAINVSDDREIKIRGDLVAYTDWESTTPRETLPARFVTNTSKSLESYINSPILLLGDSHTLVYSDEGAFHCEGAGLFDHLSAAMGQAVDLEGSSSGGLVTSRINLYRKAASNPGYWDKKKAVVWVFTSREFTQSTFRKGFISIPIERK